MNALSGLSRPSAARRLIVLRVGVQRLGLSPANARRRSDVYTFSGFPLHVPAALPAGSLNTLVAVGVFLVILSILGCFGVRFNYKMGGRYILGIYAFFMVLVMLMEFAAAGGYLVRHGLDWTSLECACLPFFARAIHASARCAYWPLCSLVCVCFRANNRVLNGSLAHPSARPRPLHS